MKNILICTECNTLFKWKERSTIDNQEACPECYSPEIIHTEDIENEPENYDNETITAIQQYKTKQQNKIKGQTTPRRGAKKQTQNKHKTNTKQTQNKNKIKIK